MDTAFDIVPLNKQSAKPAQVKKSLPFDIVSKENKSKGLWQSYKEAADPNSPSQLKAKAQQTKEMQQSVAELKDQKDKILNSRTGQNIEAAVDMAVSFPGQVVGNAMGAASGLDAALKGKSHEEIQKIRKEDTQAFIEANPLNNPIHRMMTAAGYTEGYDKSDVAALFDKISGGISKGGEWMEKQTGGTVGKGDFEDLVNSAINLAVPEAAKLAKKIKKNPETVVPPVVLKEDATAPKPRVQYKDIPKLGDNPKLNITPVLKDENIPETRDERKVTTTKGVDLSISQAAAIDRKGPSQELINLTHTPTPKDFSLIARDAQGKVIGYLDLSAKPNGSFSAKDLKVSPEARRMGIASELYKDAQARGYKVEPSEYQTESGKALSDARISQAIAKTKTAGSTTVESKDAPGLIRDIPRGVSKNQLGAIKLFRTVKEAKKDKKNIAPGMMRLYHSTTTDSAKNILAHGFHSQTFRNNITEAAKISGLNSLPYSARKEILTELTTYRRNLDKEKPIFFSTDIDYSGEFLVGPNETLGLLLDMIGANDKVPIKNRKLAIAASKALSNTSTVMIAVDVPFDKSIKSFGDTTLSASEATKIINRQSQQQASSVDTIKAGTTIVDTMNKVNADVMSEGMPKGVGAKQGGAVNIKALTDPIEKAFKGLGKTSFGDSLKVDTQAGIHQFMDHFNPAGRGLNAKRTESILAEKIVTRIRADEVNYTQGKVRADYFDRMGPADSIQFIKAYESKVKWKDPQKQATSDFYRKAFDDLYKADRAMGLDYDASADYFARIFKDGPTVEKYFQQKYGKKWGDPNFMKDRNFEFLNDALKHGYKLLTDNPEELYQARVHASEVARSKIDALKALTHEGLARPISKVKGVKTKNFPDGSDPVRSPDGTLYYVEPTALPVLNRAFDTNTLWNLRGPVGAVFRGGTALKNPMVGVDLGLSLFHATHVTLGMIPATELTRLTQLLTSDAITPMQWTKGVGKALVYGGKSGVPIYGAIKDGKQGNRLVKIFKGGVDPKSITAAETEAVQLMLEGGFSPVMDAKYKGGWKESFGKAIRQRSATAVLKAPFAGMEWMSSWMTEGMIPSLKADMYVKGAKAWIDSNPKLAGDPAQRGMALRAMAKNIENRFGQMNYDTLFWNKIVKDVGIFSSLSMGWKLGFMREYVAGPLGEGPSLALKAMQGKLPEGGVKGAISRGELNRTLFVANYVAMTMMYNGIKTYLNTGQTPQSPMDYVYPATGGNNPDGTPKRESTPYYTREPVMIAKHIQNEGVAAGLSHYVTASAAPQIGAAWEFMTGVDRLGKEISDPDAPAYKQLAQRTAKVLGEIKPISVQAMQKAEKLDAKTITNSIFGFTPAPKYITESKTEGKITALYQKYNAKERQPYESVQKGQDRSKLRKLYLAGDREGYEKLLTEMQQKYHLTPKQMKATAHSSQQEGIVKMFSALTETQQLNLLKDMSKEEREKFLPKAHSATKKKLKELEQE